MSREALAFVALAGMYGLLAMPSAARAQTGDTETGAAQQKAAEKAANSNPAAPSNFFARWQARATGTQALQPRWIVPAISPYPMLIQVFRSDFTRQISPTHVSTWNYGTSRGLNLIPFARTEVDVFVPPFLARAKGTPDGFGDFSVSGKYRIASGNERRGNYIVSGFVTATVPTGSRSNGATDASVNPAISAGKGWGRFDVLSTLGGTLPTGNTGVTGRTIMTNTVAQLHATKYIWPELEWNSTSWYGSTRDGKVQTFVTPGIVAGKFPLHAAETPSRTGFAAGFALQTAVTRYHTYNHSLTFTGRFLF